MKLKTQTILLIGAAGIVLGGGYWYLFGSSGGNAAPLSTVLPAQTGAQAQFETLVGELNPVSFDLGIFTDPRFMALTDLATPITPEGSGRIDPFAPLNGK